MDADKAMQRYLPMTESMAYILLALRKARHGYGIMQDVERMTGGRLRLGAGTVYQSLSKLRGDGLIRAGAEHDRQKQYELTDLGVRVLRAEAARIRELNQWMEAFEREE